MADVVFRYPEMRAAVTKIAGIADDYKRAAGQLIDDFTTATSTWEGETKDKMLTFMNTPVREYIAETIPQLIQGLSDMLAANADQMEKVDAEIASNIPASL